MKPLEGDHGLLIQLGPQLYGRVHLTDVADRYSAEPLAAYKRNQVVKCCVLQVHADSKQVDLSLRPSRVNPEAKNVCILRKTDTHTHTHTHTSAHTCI